MPAELVLNWNGWMRRLPLGGDPVVLGRAPDCGMSIPDSAISRQHCRIVPDIDGGWLVEDLGSRGGTLLDRVRLSKAAPLLPGMEFRIGGASFHLELQRAEPSPAAADGQPQKLELLLQTVGELYGTEDLDGLLRTIVDRTILLAGGDRGALLLASSEGKLEVAVARNAGGLDLPPNHALTRTLPQLALQNRESVVLTDTEGREQAAPASVVSRGLKSVLCVPLPERAGASGVLYVESIRPATEFSAADLALFEALAVQLALAIDRTQHLQRERELHRRIEAENAALKTQLGALSPIGESPPMQKALEVVRRIAPTDAAVCFTGETGTGKEVLARHLHELSSRAKGPFIIIDCGALPEGLIESELFGYERGAFTGAVGSKLGRFREAERGTVFLDEIGELPLSLQPKLLRVLQEHTVQPVGGSRRIPVDVRVVCATHRDLVAKVRDGTFREDLYYRISVVGVAIPPLRERGQDVLLLAESFLDRYSALYGFGVRRLTRDASEALLRHDWRGNIRELQNRIQQAVLLATSPFITERDLHLGGDSGAASEEQAVSGWTAVPLQQARELAIERFERAYVAEALQSTGGNVSRAAEISGVTRRAFQRLMRRNEMNRSNYGD